MSETLWSPLALPEDGKTTLADWLVQMAQPDMHLLLAHCEDEVVWGQVVWDKPGTTGMGKLLLAGGPTAAPRVQLDDAAVQQARLFGQRGELLVWRTARGLAARLIWSGGELPAAAALRADAPAGVALPDALPDEDYLLWGDRAVAQADGFVLLEEGRQGLRHAPPLADLPQGARAVLRVRHYVEYGQDGHARIGLSRLVGLGTRPMVKGGA